MLNGRIFAWMLLAQLASGSLMGQSTRLVDSLKQLLQREVPDSQRVEWLYQIGQEVEPADPETAKFYYTKALDVSKRKGYAVGEVKFYFNYTAALNMQARFDSSLMLNQQGTVLARKLGDPLLVAKCLQNTGVSFFYLGDYDSCASYYLQAAPFFEKANDSLRLSILYSNLGSVYREIGWLDRSLYYHQQAQALSAHRGDDRELARTLSNLGIVYTDLRRYTKADSCIQAALTLARRLNDDYLQQNALLNATNVALQQRQYTAVVPLAEQASKLSGELGDSLGYVIAQRALGLAAFYGGRFVEAKDYVQRVLPIAERQGLEEQRPKLYALLADASLAQGQLSDYQFYQLIADSLETVMQSKRLQDRIQVLDKRFETEKKNLKIQSLIKDQQIKRIWILILIGLFAAGLLMGWLLWRNQQQKRRLERQRLAELEQERKWLASEALVQGQEEERKRLAKDLHDGLGGLLSGVKLQLGAMKGNIILSAEQGQTFETALSKLDESIREMRRVAQNMMPEALMNLGIQQAISDYAEQVASSSGLRVVGELHGLNERLTGTHEIAIYRIVQELLNNVVKHARASQVLLQVIRHDTQVSITVEDNGLGFDASLWQQQPGVGLKSVMSRVNFLGGQLDVSSAPDKGTSIHIEFSI